jgi:hypothetical protein
VRDIIKVVALKICNNTHALRSKNGVLGMGVLESRPWVDQRVVNVSLDQGRSGGRFIVLLPFAAFLL